MADHKHQLIQQVHGIMLRLSSCFVCIIAFADPTCCTDPKYFSKASNSSVVLGSCLSAAVISSNL